MQKVQIINSMQYSQKQTRTGVRKQTHKKYKKQQHNQDKFGQGRLRSNLEDKHKK